MATLVENPGGVIVEVTDEHASELLEQDGFAKATQPDDEPTDEPPAAPTSGEDDKPGAPLHTEDGIREALDEGSYNRMRSELSKRVSGSTQGMTKSEVREALEMMLEQ